MSPWLYLLTGLACAAAGGDLFERGLVGLAKWLRVPAGIIGATVAAFATSSPELSVSISSALAGTPEIALGDALGSNVVNIGLVLGLVACLGALAAPRHSIRRDFPVALLAPLLTLVLAMDGTLSRLDGALLLAGFTFWLLWTLHYAKSERDRTAETIGETDRSRIVVSTAIGFVALVFAGRLIVTGAESLGQRMGLETFVIGATMVAVGTSIPELTTALISRLRKRGEVGLGTLIGSNIFNGLFIVGLAATIHPIRVGSFAEPLGLACGFALVVLAWPWRADQVAPWQGFVLLGGYTAYVVAILANR